MRRYAARVDSNQTEIVAALRAAGALVLSLAAMGKGTPDLLVQYRRRLYLLELKTATGKLTEDQRAFEAQGWSFAVVRSAEEALAAIGAA